MSRGRRGRSLHLVEVGVHWPPETFLCRKLEGLAARGMRVAVAPNVVDDEEAVNESSGSRRSQHGARGSFSCSLRRVGW